jgi:hypothetical protein
MGVHGIFCFSVSFVLFCDGGLGLRRCYLFLQWEGFFLFELGIFFVLFTCVFPFSLPYLTIAIRFIIIIRRRHYSFYLGILGKGRREERDDEMKSEKEIRVFIKQIEEFVQDVNSLTAKAWLADMKIERMRVMRQISATLCRSRNKVSYDDCFVLVRDSVRVKKRERVSRATRPNWEACLFPSPHQRETQQ